ncbi:MAG: hypothetical protein IPK76_13845 [Lewinellaceae bacterium]|nr:hypothetical protein [Lewinellaceae bacterium]
MKTFLLLLLVATSLQPVTAQDELAALDNVQPFYSSIPPDNTAAAEPLMHSPPIPSIARLRCVSKRACTTM